MTLCKQLQEAVAGFLKTVGPLQGVPVVSRREKTLENDIEAQIEGFGICLYVFPGLPQAVNQNNPGPYVDRMEVRVRVMENTELNTRLPDAYEVAEHVLAHLHHHCPLIEGAPQNPLICREQPIVEIPGDEVQFDILFDLSVGIALRAS